MLRGADAVAGGDCESETWTVNGFLPVIVGMPEISPVGASRFNPGGKAACCAPSVGRDTAAAPNVVL